MKKKLINYIEENKNELFDILCHLLSVNTENNGSYGNEREIAEYMNAEFSRLRVESQVYSPDDVEGLKSHPDYLAGRNLEMRYNVTARLKGKDSQKSLMLAGHIDTVPVGDLSLWTVPPVQGTIKDGRIYGRGANDDKFALAVELFLVRAVKKLGIEFKNDIYLSGYVDEEYGGGDGALACCVKYPCDFYLNMDSDYMDIIHCGVGGQRLAVNLVYPGPKDACDDMIEAIYFAKKEIDYEKASY